MEETKFHIPIVIVVIAICSMADLFGAVDYSQYTKDTIDGKVFYRYPVEKSTGLYRISVNFGVSQEEIIKYNPGIKDSGLRYGETVLLIPVKTEQPEVVNNPIDKVDTLTEKKVRDVKKTSEPKLPPRVEVRDEMLDLLSQVKDSVSFSDTSKNITPDPIIRNIGILLPFVPNKIMDIVRGENIFWEFYLGILLGAKCITSENYKLNLHFFNTGKGVNELDSLITAQVLDTLDAVLGPVYNEQVAYISPWIKQHRIPFFIPFADDIEIVSNNPNIYQFNMSDKLKIYTALRYLKSHRDSVHCIFVYDDTIPSMNITLALKKKIYSQYISYNEISANQLLNDSLQYFVERERENVVIFFTDKYNIVKRFFPAIRLTAKSSDIKILGEYSWSENDIGVPLLYCSVFTHRFDSLRVSYDVLYLRYFGQRPENKLLRYDLLGYDLICHMASVLDNIPYQPLQSDIRFVRLKENSGFINRNANVESKK